MVSLDERFLKTQWFALKTKSNHERKVSALLEGKGVESFLPMRRIERKWKDRKKMVDFPLFPGYLFVHAALLEKNKIVQTPSVVNLVGSGEPQPIPEIQIIAVKRFLEEEIQFDPYPYLVPGREVEVVRGPLKGIRGVLAQRKGKHRLIVNIPMINSLVEAEIDAADIGVDV